MSNNTLKDKIQSALNFGLKQASKSGASHSEGFGLYQNAYNFQLEKNLPKHNLGIRSGIAFRIIVDHSMGFAYTSSFSNEDIKQTIKLAIENARAQKKDENITAFPQPKKNHSAIFDLDKKLYSLSVDDASSAFEQLELDELPKDLYFLQSMGIFQSGDSFLKNSNGIDIHEQFAGYGLGTGFLSIRGMPSYDFHLEGTRSWGDINPREISKKALEKTMESGKPKTMNIAGKYPVIITPDASYGLFGGLFVVLSRLLHGDKASRGDSAYADKIGEKVAPANFTLIDDPLDTRFMTASQYDAEGIPTQRTELIKDGVLQTYYLDSYYGRKLGLESNGKAVRGGMMGGNPVSTPPSIGSYTTIIEPGDATVDEMIEEIKEGFMMKSLMGIHMSDFSSGRFSVTGSGWYIKKGEVKTPVQDISMSGTIPELLLNIDLISKETQQGLNNEVPYLRITELDVTGKKLDFKVRIGYKIMKILVKLGIIKNPLI